MISNFIDTYQVLAPHECERIIDYYRNDDRKERGQVIGDANLDEVKQSTDVYVKFGDKWDNVDDNKYNDIIVPAVNYAVNQWIENHKFLTTMPPFRVFEQYNIQHYKDGEGYFSLHCECQPDKAGDQFVYRMGAWMIYLNDAESGTEFPYQELVLQPKQGICAVWPAYYTHPHKGVTPNRGDKYIATGWINFFYSNDERLK